MSLKCMDIYRGVEDVKFRRYSFLGATGLVFATVLSGCAVSANSDNASNSSSNTSQNGEASTSSQTTINFMFWGSNFEQQAQQQMARDFQKQNPSITVSTTIIPSDYQTKLNTLLAANQLPDTSYLDEGQAAVWGSEGHILNMAPYVAKYKQLQGWIPETKISWAPGKFTTMNTLETELLFYNPTLFKKAGVAVPPTDPGKAWTWSQFVAVAERLTVDDHGLHPNQKGFDPNHIVQYGVNIPIGGYTGWYPYLLSAGGDITNTKGTKYTMNSPQAVQTFQNLHDLIYKYHVMPSPADQSNLPADNVLLQTGKFGMVIDGQWNLLSFAQSHVNVGVAALPKIEKPADILFSGAGVIYSTTKHPDAAVKFDIFETNPLSPLVEGGLWMPVEEKYYSNKSLLNKWTNNSAHPSGYKTTVPDYVLHYDSGDPETIYKNWPQIDNVIEQKLSLIWDNKESVKSVLDQIGKQVQPLLQGKW